MVAELLGLLAANDVRGVAAKMLQYYDKLYDKHVGNASGSGSGTGARPGHIAEVCADPEAEELDDDGLARVVLEAAQKWRPESSTEAGLV